MIKELIKIANELDRKGLQKEADALDGIIRKLAEKNEKSLTSLFERLNKGPSGRATLWPIPWLCDPLNGQTIENLKKVLGDGWEKEDCFGNLQNPCGIKRSEAEPDLLWIIDEIKKFYGIEVLPLNGGQLEYFSIGLIKVCDDGSPTPL
jgi:hypothetical protein